MGDIGQLVQSPITGGVVLALCLAALKWMDRDRLSILSRLTQEREQRIKALEERTKVCEEDRIQLHSQISAMQKDYNELQVEIRHMMTAMLKSKSVGDCNTECAKAKVS